MAFSLKTNQPSWSNPRALNTLGRKLGWWSLWRAFMGWSRQDAYGTKPLTVSSRAGVLHISPVNGAFTAKPWNLEPWYSQSMLMTSSLPPPHQRKTITLKPNFTLSGRFPIWAQPNLPLALPLSKTALTTQSPSPKLLSLTESLGSFKVAIIIPLLISLFIPLFGKCVLNEISTPCHFG